MATESFFEDIVIDTPEAKANLLSFMEEEPHIAVEVDGCIRHADKTSMDCLIQKHRRKDRYGLRRVPGGASVRSPG